MPRRGAVPFQALHALGHPGTLDEIATLGHWHRTGSPGPSPVPAASPGRCTVGALLLRGVNLDPPWRRRPRVTGDPGGGGGLVRVTPSLPSDVTTPPPGLGTPRPCPERPRRWSEDQSPSPAGVSGRHRHSSFMSNPVLADGLMDG